MRLDPAEHRALSQALCCFESDEDDQQPLIKIGGEGGGSSAKPKVTNCDSEQQNAGIREEPSSNSHNQVATGVNTNSNSS